MVPLGEDMCVYIYISLPKLGNRTCVENVCSMMAGSIIHWPLKDPFLNLLCNFGSYFHNTMYFSEGLEIIGSHIIDLQTMRITRLINLVNKWE